tara:strand:+ start:254 stop:652 length:399 start_codon:yes stop_codon:yes gene_type:complete
MKQSILKNPKNISILHQLISSGYYVGFVKPDSFELKRKKSLNNFGVIGILGNNQKFLVKPDFTGPMKYFVKLLNILGVIIAIGLIFIKSNWIIAILYFVIRLSAQVYINIQSEKEVQIFSSKFIELGNLLEN